MCIIFGVDPDSGESASASISAVPAENSAMPPYPASPPSSDSPRSSPANTPTNALSPDVNRNDLFILRAVNAQGDRDYVNVGTSAQSDVRADTEENDDDNADAYTVRSVINSGVDSTYNRLQTADPTASLRGRVSSSEATWSNIQGTQAKPHQVGIAVHTCSAYRHRQLFIVTYSLIISHFPSTNPLKMIAKIFQYSQYN